MSDGARRSEDLRWRFGVIAKAERSICDARQNEAAQNRQQSEELIERAKLAERYYDFKTYYEDRGADEADAMWLAALSIVGRRENIPESEKLYR